MRKKLRVIAIANGILFYCALFIYGLSSGSLNIPFFTIASAGGQTLSGGSLTLNSTVSQAAGGASMSGGSVSMTSGFTSAVVPLAAANLSAAHAFPTPFRPSRGHTKITFTDLTSSATIKIYTISGELVRTLSKTDSSANLDWDVRNEKGEALASGVYLFAVQNAGEIKKGKLMIIK